MDNYRHLHRWWYASFYFLYTYVVKLGCLDGKAGFVYASYKAWYFKLIARLLAEQRVHQSQQRPRSCRGQHAEPGRSRMKAGRIGAHGAKDERSFETKIYAARFLSQAFAERNEHEGCGHAQGAAEHGDRLAADVKVVLPVSAVDVLAHVQQAGKGGKPHSHGASWAVYGNATGVTEMTEWKRVNPETDDHAVLTATERYVLNVGDTHTYGPGVIHSTAHPEKAYVVRVAGTDLDAIPRFKFRKSRDQIV